MRLLTVIVVIEAIQATLMASFAYCHMPPRNAISELATQASDTESIVTGLRQAQRLGREEIRAFINGMWSNADPRIRLYAAFLLAKVDANNLDEAAVKGLLQDQVRNIREVAWLSVRKENVSQAMEIDAGRSPDPVVRASVVLRRDNGESLIGFCYDRSPLVRAITIRRLARLALTDTVDRDALNTGLLVCLVDHDQIVRSNAIIAARSIQTLPILLGPGLIIDGRELMALENVFAGSKETEDLRKEMHLEGEFFPVVFQLLSRQLQSTNLNAPPTGARTLLLPLGESALIGSEAANLWFHVDSAHARETIEKVLEAREQSAPLQHQLRAVLGKE